MDKAVAVAKIRKQLTEGNLEAALQLLIENIEPERNNLRDLSNRAIQAKVHLEKTQKDELDGVISLENRKLSYNQITRQVVNLVQEWENASGAPTAESPVPKGKFTPKMILVAVTLVIFAAIITWQVFASKEEATTAISIGDDCPVFDPESFNIMVLPYQDFRDPESASSPHRPLATRLNRFKQEFSGAFKISVGRKDQPIPETDEDAIRSAQDCLAELAIWGEYEQFIPAELGTIVTTNYKYLTTAETFELTMLNLDDEAHIQGQRNASNIPTRGFFVDTIQTYSEIVNNGRLTDELEDQFRFLFGVAVWQGGDAETAADILKKTEPKDSNSILLKEMALAESYIKKGDKTAAVKAYDRALSTHPNYWFAVNNRAMLYFEKGDYAETIATLDRTLEEDPNNINALTVRGAVRIKTQQLKEAEVDLRKAEDLNKQQAEAPDTVQQQYIQRKIDLLERAKTTENQRIDKAKNILERDRSNVAALTDLAEANRNLGAYRDALQYADQILTLDQNNTKALAVKLEASDMTKSKGEVSVITGRVRQLDTATQRTILQQRPTLRKILNQ